ncbi:MULTISPECIES: hypothetical protein [Pseudonocardia]|nr:MULTISPECIES: hypothetical protein [Pseudonocardia]
MGTLCVLLGLAVGALAGHAVSRRRCAARHHRHDRLTLRRPRR